MVRGILRALKLPSKKYEAQLYNELVAARREIAENRYISGRNAQISKGLFENQIEELKKEVSELKGKLEERDTLSYASNRIMEELNRLYGITNEELSYLQKEVEKTAIKTRKGTSRHTQSSVNKILRALFLFSNGMGIVKSEDIVVGSIKATSAH